MSLVPATLVGRNTVAFAVNPAGTVQGGVSFTTTADPQAHLWTGTADSVVDLGAGDVRAVGATVQIGLAGLEGALSERARLWRGSAASVVDLHPAGYVASNALGGDDDIQVGRGRPTDTTSHALLWRGTAASAVDLHPAGYTNSRGYGGAGDVQVGGGDLGIQHALLWRGSAASVVDLGPGVAWACSGDVQVGQGPEGGSTHAFLWRGTEASRVDLHPVGFADSRAFGVAGTRQVGYGSLGSEIHALLWEGTAASAIDLHAFTQSLVVDGNPPRHSFAQGIDAAGNVVGFVRSVTGSDYAVTWLRQ